ncbi:helix-turn-helix domain-containing protein [Actinomyces dentalis]
MAAGATVTEVAKALGISGATIYRYANPPKTSDLPRHGGH